MVWARLLRHMAGLLPAFAVCAALISCASLDGADYDDYVGPPSRQVITTIERQSDEAASGLESAPISPSPPEIASGPLEVSVEDAILLGLENNRGLAVERLTPPLRRTVEDEERAVFDPTLGGQISKQRSKSDETDTDVVSGNMSINQFLPTGTALSLEGSTATTDSSLSSGTEYASRTELGMTQSLLRGLGAGVNLARLRQARLSTLGSQYELRGFAESLVAEIEKTYWDFSLAQRQIDIFTDSLKLAEQQLNETVERINIGKLAEIELSAARAEVALRQEDLINARSAMATTRLQLLRLLNPRGEDLWNREIVLINQPIVPDVELDDVNSHVQTAMRMRTDLNQARLQTQQGDLEVVKTRNGLLPKMDLFMTLGRTGYADSFNRSINALDDDTYDVMFGLTFEYPPGNRGAEAQHRRALLSLDQQMESVKNLAQLVEVDVRSAYIEVNRAKESVAATAATRTFQEDAALAETEKFRVGKSTAFLVARAQRDLVSSRISETKALTDYLKALIDLYQLDGSLLDRRGIVAPGQERIELELP